MAVVVIHISDGDAAGCSYVGTSTADINVVYPESIRLWRGLNVIQGDG
jgi:hypothetical protein